MSRPARAIIDLDALRANLQRVHACAPNQRIMGAIKANAYGHGAVKVAKALESQLDAFAVRCFEEAFALRLSGITCPIILLEGFFSADELPAIVEQNLQIVVHTAWQFKILLSVQLSKPISVWLKVDTGMHRLGLAPNDIVLMYRHLKQCTSIADPIRLMSHLACADDRHNDMTVRQSDIFFELVDTLKAESSLANSAGILGWPQTHADWVRPGIMLYGVSPFPDTIAKQSGLQAVMQLESALISIKRIQKGEGIGYGSTWICPKTMLVGIVAIGYADGYPRHAPSGTPVLVNDTYVPLIGRVSMDMIAVDLRSQENAKVGDPVILWGKDLPVEEIARLSGTIAYELLCHVNVVMEK